MKLAFFNDFRLGVVKGETIVDVSAAVQDIPHTGPGDLMSGLIARFDSYRGKLEAGRRADLVILSADPRIDVAAVDAISQVMINGKFVDRARLMDKAAARRHVAAKTG